MSKPDTDPKQNNLFRRFPLISLKNTSQGALPVPYHIYDGQGIFIGGETNLAAVRRLMAGENVYPVETTNGQALLGIWVVDATEASLGAHQELQFSIVVAHRPLPPVPAHPLVILHLLLHNPEVRLLCHGLWNNTEKVVAYNRDVLALNSRLAYGTLEPGGGNIRRFTFVEAGGTELISGEVGKAAQTQPATVLPMLRLMGLRRFMQASSTPVLPSQVVNTKGLLSFNADAQAYLSSSKQVLQFFNPATDRLAITAPEYRELDFQGKFVEHLEGFKFVYLNIHNAGDRSFQ